MSTYLANLTALADETPVLAEFFAEWDADPSRFIDGTTTVALRLLEAV